MDKQSVVTTQPQATLGSYTLGFILSLLLTAIPFSIVMFELMSGAPLIVALVASAIGQLFVQLYFFLHLGSEAKPRWNLTAFLFMLIIVFILVAGSLWIMQNLDYNMMPSEMNDYMREQVNRGF